VAWTELEKRCDDVNGNSYRSAVWICQGAIKFAIVGLENYTFISIRGMIMRGGFSVGQTYVVANDE